MDSAEQQHQVQMELEHSVEVTGTEAPAISSSSSALPIGLNSVVCQTLDIESYISRYEGYTKIKRLTFIAERCTNLQADAYRLAIQEVKKGINTSYYQILTRDAGRLGSQYAFDAHWVEETDRTAHIYQDRLEAELNTAKSRMIKDHIRMGYNDLGDFFYRRGELQEALKCYVRTRDYCTQHKHTADMCLNVIKVSSDLLNWKHVTNYVAKGEQLETFSQSVEFAAKLKSASALVSLHEQQFKVAARRFTSVECVTLGFNQVISSEDVAVYGTLCSLATLDRQELRKRVFENNNFKSLLDLVPSVRDLAHDFFYGRYGSCLSRLAQIKPELELDLHLHTHVSNLTDMLQESLYTHYFSPYLSVDLTKMAAAFCLSVTEVEQAVSRLIGKDHLPARIDSLTKTLHRKQHDDRCISLSKVLSLSETHMRESHAALLRLSLLQHDFTITSAWGRDGADTGMGLGGRSNAEGNASTEMEVLLPEENLQEGGSC